jgi:hypothetical protein
LLLLVKGVQSYLLENDYKKTVFTLALPVGRMSFGIFAGRMISLYIETKVTFAAFPLKNDTRF